MPKVNPCYKKAVSVPPPDYFKEMTSRYRTAQGISLSELGEKLGCTGQNAGHQLNRNVFDYRIADVVQICAALNIPIDKALQAIAKTIKEGAAS